MLTFILASGRTGTVFMESALSEVSGVTSCHERYGRLLRIIEAMHASGVANSLFQKIAKGLICFPLYKYRNNDLIHIEVNNMIRSFIDIVFDCFPEATYIHIVRDPREHVRSGVNWTANKPIMKYLKLYFPYLGVHPEKFTLGQTQLDKIFEIVLMNWVRSNECYGSLASKAKNYHLLKFEDFVSAPALFMQKLLQLADYKNYDQEALVQAAVGKASQNRSEKCISSWREWEDKYINYISSRCTDLMSQYGYGNDKEWKDRVLKSSG
ncbi:MAG: hypothetical protein ABII88_11025 [Candidatus Omnitrophota bacterium]